MPQREIETSSLQDSLQKYRMHVKKLYGERTLYTFDVGEEHAHEIADSVRGYALKNRYVYTDEEMESMGSGSLEVYVYDHGNVVVASRTYTKAMEKRAVEESENIARYALELLRNRGMLRN
ncbi:MAG: hypothetical protein M1544_00060 [Candidatus Marsarchaeota archaeon]|nr:hypothetical protein [Candidatus Marsarchaeota archaeon]